MTDDEMPREMVLAAALKRGDMQTALRIWNRMSRDEREVADMLAREGGYDGPELDDVLRRYAGWQVIKWLVLTAVISGGIVAFILW